MKLDVSAFEDSFKGRDIIFYSKMHQTPGGTLSSVTGYLWDTTCRQKIRSKHRGRGSGGVAVLFKEELQPIIRIVRRDEHARYMWVRLRAEIGKSLYIAICYFPPSTSHYTPPKGQSPYMVLNEDIWVFSTDGIVIILGDFNARTGHSQTPFYNTLEEMLRELNVSDMGLVRCSQDEEHTGYGGYLTNMGTTHGLAILNGIQGFPTSSDLTCLAKLCPLLFRKAAKPFRSCQRS